MKQEHRLLMQMIDERLGELVIFRPLLKDPAIQALRLFARSKNDRSRRCAYALLTRAIYQEGGSWQAYLLNRVLTQENFYIQSYGAGETPAPCIETCARQELAVLDVCADLQPAFFEGCLDRQEELPEWTETGCGKHFITEQYQARLAQLHRCGYGIFAGHHMFIPAADGSLEPVRCPDPITLDDLIGYEQERRAVIDNTLALLGGKFAANVLLSGDAGTGKSATVKAIVNAYHEQGLRLIELNKAQLHLIPRLMEKLSRNPLKFILFVDDLTFSENDPNFGTLKAILEGSAAARQHNTVIYATSNRRHLVRETFDDGSDKHAGDTIQEQLSLSERFGLTVTFIRPDKNLYLEIVRSLADAYHLDTDRTELDAAAERYALTRSGRSARAARQFIEMVASGRKI